MSAVIKTGVSVILCCYNSAGRIRETLQALARQDTSLRLQWEVVLVNNASTDNTAIIAQSVWKSFGTLAELRIIDEPKPGLGNARRCGARAASYSYLLFCDDDNWLTSDYVQHAFDILDTRSSVAACGGMGIPVFESAKPGWFDEYSEAFALGPQETNAENGKILNLYGAGLCIKKKVWDKLEQSDFVPVLQGRTGKSLSSSEDTELTYAMVLMGYDLYYTDKLQFFHYLPKERLTYAYLKKLFAAFGNDGPVRNLYYSMISDRFFHKKIQNWNFHLLLSVFRLVKYVIAPPKKNGRAIYFNWSIAYIRELLVLRKSYPLLRENILRIKNTSAVTIIGNR